MHTIPTLSLYFLGIVHFMVLGKPSHFLTFTKTVSLLLRVEGG